MVAENGKKEMNILVVSCVSDLSESTLYISLAESGYSVEIICDPRESRVEEFRAAGIEVRVRSIRSRLDFVSALFIRKCIQKGSFDLIYSPFNKGLSTALLATLGLGLPVVSYRGTLGNLSRLDPSSYLTHLNPNLSAIICNCRAVKSSLLSVGVAEEKLHVIYKGHDPSWYRSGNSKNREELSLKPSDFVIGIIANIRPLKGVRYLIESLAEIRAEIPAHLVVIGDLPNNELVQLSHDLGLESLVHFIGFRSDAREFLPLFDVFVMPSIRREGFPRAVVEAYCSRIPAIVTNVGGMPELVRNGESGIVVSPKNSHELAQALIRIARLPDRGRSLGERGFELVQSEFHVNTYVEKVRMLFESLCDS